MIRRPKERIVTVRTTEYTQQMLSAERIMREKHEELIRQGYTWDGMDGYTKQVVSDGVVLELPTEK